MLKRSSYYLLITLLLISQCSVAQSTEKVYLSGTGSDQTVKWDFFCTGGMNANKWTTIDVPSCWELQGFGKYNYGLDKDSAKGKEHGLYKHKFNVPKLWKGKQINIVFEGVMTDAIIKINGKVAGPIHQGAFYSFKYNITKFLKYGKANLLEVDVAKYSANNSVNAAERRGDYWIFGGIFRPVWLEVLPASHIETFAIDAKADGSFYATMNVNEKVDSANVWIYTREGISIGVARDALHNGTTFQFYTKIHKITAWSPESPELYNAFFSIYKGGKEIHVVPRHFGFRTVEVRGHDGIYVNDVKVKLKGVCRHSFRPETGRTLCKANSIEDVNLIKGMNMNAVRMSHYPPDDHFLDACDSLGLFVLDELGGWHGAYDTTVGTNLVYEMVTHDRNHPSIILWDNGNEGGNNTGLDELFPIFDLQKRTVIHPWSLFGNINTMHYRQYNYGVGDYNHGRDIVMPTEFLHGWFDGGHAAGLEDYWEAMWHDPLAAGGFLWDFADEGVVRHDLHDSIDTDKFHAADGIMGPHFEKEGSYDAIKEIWSPVHFEKKELTETFDGKLNIENRYFYTNLSQCHFTWKLQRFYQDNPSSLSGKAVSPGIKPSDHGILQIPLPTGWHAFDVLYVTATDPFDREIFTWSFPILSTTLNTHYNVHEDGDLPINVKTIDSIIHVEFGKVNLSFNKNNGLLTAVRNEKGDLPFNNGPVIQEGDNNFKDFKQYFDGKNYVIASTFDRKNSYNTLQWTIYPSGWVKMDVHYFPNAMYTNFDGVNFSLPGNDWKSFSYLGNGPYRVWKNRMRGGVFGMWDKKYNNTETGESPWIYPEFKGYYSNFYSGTIYTKTNQFTVVTETEDLFLRVLSAAWKTDQWHNYEPYFPTGDISFMNGIPSIGSKSQTAESTGPMGEKNIYYDYGHDPSRALHIILYFNFSAVK